MTAAASSLATPRPLRVAHLLLDLDAAGAQMVCARLATRLPSARFTSSVLALEGPGPLESWLEDREVPVVCLKAVEGARPELVFGLGARLRGGRIDVLHCHNCKPMLYGGLAAMLAPRVRVVMTKHGLSHWTTGTIARAGRLVMRRAAAVTAVSSEISRELTAGSWVAPGRLQTIPNGVDTEEFAPPRDRSAARARLGYGPEHRIIGMVQRLSPEKDPANLLRAFDIVARALPEARLLVVGEGPLRPELEFLAAGSGIADRVRFLGVRQDVPEILGAVDAFCLPSRTEGTSLSLLEAMACGVPVVATAVGGTPDVLAGERAGLLAPPERPDLLAAALLRVLGEREAARAMGVEGRKLACSRFSLAVSVERYAALYERIASRRP